MKNFKVVHFNDALEEEVLASFSTYEEAEKYVLTLGNRNILAKVKSN